MRLLFALLVVCATSVAHADARQDIVDIRHGSMPERTEVLGWTADGAFVFRRTACILLDLSNISSCSVTIDVASRGHTESHVLFGKDWPEDCSDESDDPSLSCSDISMGEAMKFIRTERALIGSLGTLHKGPPGATKLASGKLVPVEYEDREGARRRIGIMLVRGGRWRVLGVISSLESESSQHLRDDPRIDRVEISPDGASIAVVSTVPFQDTDFYFDSHFVSVMPNPDR